jgi:hypothetical protein
VRGVLWDGMGGCEGYGLLLFEVLGAYVRTWRCLAAFRLDWALGCMKWLGPGIWTGLAGRNYHSSSSSSAMDGQAYLGF